jgi:hypothetical protein
MIASKPSTLRTWFLLGALLALTIPSVAAAQAPTSVDSVKVSLWPEYDRSDVLVIYRVILPATAELPTRVRLLVPADAPVLTAAAYRDASGGLVNAAFTSTDGELADVIDVETEGTDLQIEFYLPLPVTGELRQFSFVWPGGLATDDFSYEVQQPLGAQDLQVEPAPTSRTTDALGLTYHLVELGAQTAEDRPEVAFSYDKSTSQLSANAVAPSGGLGTPSPAPRTPVDVRGLLPWILLIAGVGLITAGVVYFLRTRSKDRPPRSRHPAIRPQAEREQSVDASPVFCHNCGTQATTSDRFCRQCGVALRV